jgi:hypothetical protein
MNNKKTIEYYNAIDATRKCSVKGCIGEAKWKVFHTKYYSYNNTTLRDRNCYIPLLCDSHKQEDEKFGIITNQNSIGAYSEYEALEKNIKKIKYTIQKGVL